jgi:hypothetical protein
LLPNAFGGVIIVIVSIGIDIVNVFEQKDGMSI